MKIEIKISTQELYYLSTVFQETQDYSVLKVFENNATTINIKLVMSICIDLGDRITTQYEAAVRKASLFDEKKKHPLKLKYHEAYILNILLQGKRKLETDAYKMNTALSISLKIDPKL